MPTLQGHILTPLPPQSPSCVVQICNCGLMAVFEADLAHKQAKEVFRALITQSLPLSLALSYVSPPPPPLSFSLFFSPSSSPLLWFSRSGPCFPDNCKQLGKLVAPPSPSRGLLVYILIEANVKTVKVWKKQDASTRWNSNCQPAQILRVFV